MNRLSLLLTLPLILCVTHAWADTPTLEKLLAAMEAREKIAHSAEFTWQEECTTFPKTHLIEKEWLPTEKRVQKSNDNALKLQDDCILFSYYARHLKDTRHPITKSTHSFDGQVLATFDPATRLDYPQGILYSTKASDFQEKNNLAIWPFLFAIRPLSLNGLALTEGDLSVISSPVSPPGCPACIEIEWKRFDEIRRLVFDPQNGYRLNKLTHHFRDNQGELKPGSTLEITEYKQAQGLHIPAKWRIAFNNAKGPESECRCTLDKFQINRKIPTRDFSIFPFPVGTLVTDRRTPPDKTFWQKEDGILEPIPH